MMRVHFECEAGVRLEVLQCDAQPPLAGIEDVSLESDLTKLRGKVDRAEKYDRGEVDAIEQSVSDLQGRVDKAQTETASARCSARFLRT